MSNVSGFPIDSIDFKVPSRHLRDSTGQLSTWKVHFFNVYDPIFEKTVDQPYAAYVSGALAVISVGHGIIRKHQILSQHINKKIGSLLTVLVHCELAVIAVWLFFLGAGIYMEKKSLPKHGPKEYADAITTLISEKKFPLAAQKIKELGKDLQDDGVEQSSIQELIYPLIVTLIEAEHEANVGKISYQKLLFLACHCSNPGKRQQYENEYFNADIFSEERRIVLLGNKNRIPI